MFKIRGDYLTSLSHVLEQAEHLETRLQLSGTWEASRTEPLSRADRKFVRDVGEGIVNLLDTLGCPLTAVAYRRLRERIAEDQQFSVEQFCKRLQDISDRFTDEMGTNNIFVGARDRAHYWGRDDHVSEAVNERFPGVAQELRFAGSAYCAGLYIASVFHAMRAAEIGLRAAASELDVDLSGDENMKNLVDLIRKGASAYSDGPKAPQKRLHSQRYCELAIEAGLFKDAWRNHVSHGTATYEEMQAKEILGATCRLFERLVAPAPKLAGVA